MAETLEETKPAENVPIELTATVELPKPAKQKPAKPAPVAESVKPATIAPAGDAPDYQGQIAELAAKLEAVQANQKRTELNARKAAVIAEAKAAGYQYPEDILTHVDIETVKLTEAGIVGAREAVLDFDKKYPNRFAKVAPAAPVGTPSSRRDYSTQSRKTDEGLKLPSWLKL